MHFKKSHKWKLIQFHKINAKNLMKNNLKRKNTNKMDVGDVSGCNLGSQKYVWVQFGEPKHGSYFSPSSEKEGGMVGGPDTHAPQL